MLVKQVFGKAPQIMYYTAWKAFSGFLLSSENNLCQLKCLHGGRYEIFNNMYKASLPQSKDTLIIKYAESLVLEFQRVYKVQQEYSFSLLLPGCAGPFQRLQLFTICPW